MASGTVRMSENRIAASSGKRVERLQRDFGRERRRLREREEAAGLRTRRVVFGQIAPRLAHQPDRRVRRGLAAQRAQERVVGNHFDGACGARASDRGGAQSISGGERPSGETLEDCERRALRRVERGERQVRGLLEHELSARRRVHHLVGKADPRRAGREAHARAAGSRAGTRDRPSRSRAGRASGDRTACAVPWSRGSRTGARPRRAAVRESRGRKCAAIESNDSPTRHTRSSPRGFTLQNTRRIRSPRLGRDGKASMCSRESSLRHDTLRPVAGWGR